MDARRVKSDLLDLAARDLGVVSLDLFASEGDKVHPTVVVFREPMVLAVLSTAMFAVVAQDASLFIAFQTPTGGRLWRRRSWRLSLPALGVREGELNLRGWGRLRTFWFRLYSFKFFKFLFSLFFSE